MNEGIVKASLVLFLGLWIAGCVEYTFWMPSADRGRIVGLYCRGGPPPGTIEFDQGGIRTSLFVWDGVTVKVSVPKGQKVPLDVNAVGFRTPNAEGYLLPRKMQAVPRGEPPIILPQTTPMVLDGADYDMYMLDFSFPPDGADRFVIHMPPLFHGQEVIRLPPVTFTLTTDWYQWVLNC